MTETPANSKVTYPKCEAQINFLERYVMDKQIMIVENGEIRRYLDKAFEICDNIPVFKCSKCEDILFDHDDEAEQFLKRDG